MNFAFLKLFAPPSNRKHYQIKLTTLSRINICNIPVDALTMQQTIDLIEEAIREKRSIHHVVINAVKVANAQKDRVLKDSIINSILLTPTGKVLFGLPAY